MSYLNPRGRTVEKDAALVVFFKFQHYLDKLPQYYPKGYTDFEALPPDWDPNERPMDNPDAEASVWLITVPGTQSIIFVLSHIVPV